jgi:hypothetical protein
MRTTQIQRCITWFAGAIACLLVISPALAGAPSDAQGAAPQGSSVPGFPVPSAETSRNKHQQPVDITFTKWVTTFPLMEGITGGDVPGEFVGEVLERQVSQRQAETCYQPAPNCGRVIRLEAFYEVQAGDRSFVALIRGGSSGDTGAAQLDGTILFGWRTGARVHVEFQTMIPASSTDSACVGAPAGKNCFQGTIHVAGVPID